MLMVREAKPEDAPAVAGVHVRAWQAAYRSLLPDDYLDGLRADDRAAQYAFGQTGPNDPTTVVALRDGIVCGFVTTGPSRDGADAGEVYAIYVDPEAWGCGAGRLLMTSGRSRLSDLGMTEAVLWVLVGNVRAERFYRADGWLADGHRRQEEVCGARVDEIRYRRSLR